MNKKGGRVHKKGRTAKEGGGGVGKGEWGSDHEYDAMFPEKMKRSVRWTLFAK